MPRGVYNRKKFNKPIAAKIEVKRELSINEATLAATTSTVLAVHQMTGQRASATLKAENVTLIIIAKPRRKKTA